MDVQHPDPGIRSSARHDSSAEFQARLRTAFDVALIVAMLAAPFLLVGLQHDDAQILAKVELPPMQLAQTPAP
ncbi:MAG: hypothetical protein ABIP49_08690 [Lysobacterales bacterium]